MASLGESLPGAVLGQVMEQCGRKCAHKHAESLIQDAKGSVDALLGSFGKSVGPENAVREGDELHLRYPKCFCPMVSAGTDPIPAEYCECGRGFVLEAFSAVAGKPVTVELAESIKRGGSVCHFVIRGAGQA
jgi:predicted hydrocarbon binding protein